MAYMGVAILFFGIVSLMSELDEYFSSKPYEPQGISFTIACLLIGSIYFYLGHIKYRAKSYTHAGLTLLFFGSFSLFFILFSLPDVTKLFTRLAASALLLIPAYLLLKAGHEKHIG
jgi:hypothetical protein